MFEERERVGNLSGEDAANKAVVIDNLSKVRTTTQSLNMYICTCSITYNIYMYRISLNTSRI